MFKLYEEIRRMIIYQVFLHDTTSPEFYTMYFSNKRKADSFVAQNKKEYNDISIEKYVLKNSKTDIIQFLNKESGLAKR